MNLHLLSTFVLAAHWLIVAVLCIQVPMFETTVAIQSQRNTGRRRGLH